MKAFLLSVLGLVVFAFPAEAQAETKAKVLRAISTTATNSTTTKVLVNLVPQSGTITVQGTYGTDETYNRLAFVEQVTPSSLTYSPSYTLSGLEHGTTYFLKVETTIGTVTETKTLEFVQNMKPVARDDVFALTSIEGTPAKYRVVTVIVNGVAVQMQVPSGGGIPVLRNDRDPDNILGEEPDDELSLKRVTQPAFGRAEKFGDTILYFPGPAFLGRDQFEYVVSDPHGATSMATVTVTGLQFALFGGHSLMLQDADGGIAGYLRIDVARGGSFTGSVRVGSKSYALLGRFNSAGKFLGYARSGDDVMPVALAVSDEDGVNRLRAQIANGSIVAAEEVSRHTITSLGEAAGRYTIELPAASGGTADEDGESSVELGSGWAIMEINEWGEVQIEGETGDRQKFSAGGVLSGSPTGAVVSFYASQKRGMLAGVLNVGETVSGTLRWMREKSGSDFYPDGFDLEVNANGGRWEEPEDDRRALAGNGGDAGNMTISIAGGDVPDFERELEISKDDRVTVVDPREDELNMKIDRDDGRFKGKFRHMDDLDRRSKFRGVLLQREGRGSGVFEGDKKAGRVEVSLGSPIPDTPDPEPEPDPDPTPNPQPNPFDPGLNDPEFDFDFEF